MFYGLFCGFVRHTAAFCSGFHFRLKGENKGEKHRRFSPPYSMRFAAPPYEKFSCCLRAVCRIAETFSPASLAAAFSHEGSVTFRRTVRCSLARR